MAEGWIKLHRSILDWEWYKKPKTAALFFHLLLNANHKASKFQGRDVPKGSMVTGLLSISSDTGLSVQSVRTSLDHLKSTGEITIKSTNHFSIITITNWEKYQDINTPDNKQLTNHQQTTNNRQECKNERMKEDKNIAAGAVKKKTRLSPDWELPDEWGEWAIEDGLSHEQVVKAWPSFRDYHVGKGTLALDWKATWRTWVYNIKNKGW